MRHYLKSIILFYDKHYQPSTKGKAFCGNIFTDCPIELAAKDVFKEAKKIFEWVSFTTVDIQGLRHRYNHAKYNDDAYEKDIIKAVMSGNPDTVIRTIKLTKV